MRLPSNRPAGEFLCELAREKRTPRLIKPRRPQTNGMVERFNDRVSEVLDTHQLDARESLRQALGRYRRLYNHVIPQRALKRQTPIQALKQWQIDRPELFRKKVYDQTGLDTTGTPELSSRERQKGS